MIRHSTSTLLKVFRMVYSRNEKGRTRIVEDSFKCRYRRGDGRCDRDACRCKKDCSLKYACQNCTHSIIPYSQEPCASCYFQSKESMRKLILEYEHKHTKRRAKGEVE